LTAGLDAVILPIELGAHNPPTIVVWQRAHEWQPPLMRFLDFCRHRLGQDAASGAAAQ
jgi:hypothetical protein